MSSFFWAFEAFIPKESTIVVLVIALTLLVVLGIITFKLIVSPTRIQENIPCVLVMNLAEGSIEIFDPVWYEFSMVAALAFSGITEKFPEYKEKLKVTLDLKGKTINDFSVFAIIELLKKLSASVICLSGYGRSFSPIIFKGKQPAYNLPKEVIDQNLFLTSVESPFPLNLPENTTLRVENGAVILDHNLIKIVLKVNFNQWWRSVDSRTMLLLDISKENLDNYATIRGFISFNAAFKFRSIFSRNANNYYNYSKNMLENLRYNYSWTEFLKNLKEYVFWKHVLKNED